MIEVSGLAKRYGGRFVLRGLDLELEQGGFLALLGPNGAGKSTLLRILATLARLSLGRVRVVGCQLPEQDAAARARIGLVGHQSMLYADLSAVQNLRLAASLYAVDDGEARIDELLDLLGLARRRRDPIRIFSRGMHQRLAIARALIHRPSLLLLDEPHTGLDQDSSQVLNTLLANLSKEGVTVLMASHDLAQAASVARRFAVLAGGRLVDGFEERNFAGVNRRYSKALAAAGEGVHVR